jgi:ABC-type polysaccharide/polyol phosphate transport system ATPase subunit
MSETQANAEIAIDVKNISKEYFMGKNHSVNDGDKHFFALNDVSFTLYRGDVLGIIGSNGSGKSTLLKILSQITKPSAGQAHFFGTVTSILDVGANFHPDLTGRENVKIQLKLVNVPSKEFDAYYEKTKAFSEIGEFFDQPVKYYSSGMFLRLAFSLAFHLSSDILILDEVLSVGDEGFRLKCQELLKKFTDSGKTILFVSHNRMDILKLSNKCIWLDKGRIRKIGEPTEVLGEYFAMHRDNFDAQKTIIDVHTPHADSDGTLHLHWSEAEAPGNDILAIRELTVQSPSGTLFSSEPVEIKFLIDKKKGGVQIGAFFFLEDVFYQPVMVGHFLNNSGAQHFSNELKNQTGLVEIKSTIPANFLVPGKYFFLVRFGMEANEWHNTSSEAFRFSEKMSFTIHAKADYVDFVGDISKGSVRPPLDWSIHKMK